MDSGFWKGKRVLLTGHTGFKGSWLAIWLHKLGARVTGIALGPDTVPNLFDQAGVKEILDHHICDIRDRETLGTLIRQSSPEIVFHLAAQALVRKSYAVPVDTFDTNFTGTLNILEILRDQESLKVALFVTTDKVYADNDGMAAYSESDPLGGHDPYSASKAASEILIDSYRKSFLSGKGIAVASARAGNVIGGGDWAQDRLIPDAVRAWQNEIPVNIRMPGAIRPWQHVLDPLHGYLALARALWQDGSLATAWNFGPDAASAVSVREVIETARDSFGQGRVNFGNAKPDLHEAAYLKLDTTRIESALGIKAKLNVADAVGMTMRWYKAQCAGANARQLCLDDIAKYERLE